MRVSSDWTGRAAWILILALWIPLSGPVINPHVLEHQLECNEKLAQIPHHQHHGLHLEAVVDTGLSPHCTFCLPSQGKGIAFTTTTGPGVETPRAVAITFGASPVSSPELAGRHAPRAPPLSDPIT